MFVQKEYKINEMIKENELKKIQTLNECFRKYPKDSKVF